MKNNRMRAGLAALVAAGMLAATPGAAFADDATSNPSAGDMNDGIMVASSRYSVEDIKYARGSYVDNDEPGTPVHYIEGFDYRNPGPYTLPWGVAGDTHVGVELGRVSEPGWKAGLSAWINPDGTRGVDVPVTAPDGTTVITYRFISENAPSLNTGNLSQVKVNALDGSSVPFSPATYEYQVSGDVVVSNVPSGWQARVSNGDGYGTVFFVDPNGLSSKTYYFYGGAVTVGTAPTPTPKPDPAPDHTQIDQLASQHKADLQDGEFLFSPASGGALDVANGSRAQDANVQVWSQNWSDAQMWTVSHDNQGYVTLANKGSNLVLDAHGAKAANGTNIAQHGSNGGRNQKWIAVRNTDGSYTFLSAMDTRYALDVANGSNANGTNVRLWAANGSNAQKWKTAAWPTADKDSEGRSPVYRVYNPGNGEHLWTMSLGEYQSLVKRGWRGEDIAFHAWDKDSDAGDEVYRLYNPNSGRHHLTMSTGERDSLVKGKWRYEGVAFRYKPTDPTIWRGYNPGNGDHLWTLSKTEYDNITRNGWRGEGIAFGQGRDKAREAAFTDVDDTTPHAQAIDWMDENGISTGWWEDDANRTYRPATRVTRQDYAAFLHRLAGGEDSPKTAKSFVDVTDSTPHKADIDWATAEGFITGYGDGTFKGMSPIQRQDAVAMLWRLAGSPEPSKTAATFTDVNSSTPHAKAIAWAQETGVTTGMPDGSFGVGKPIIRQDMAAMLQRADKIINA